MDRHDPPVKATVAAGTNRHAGNCDGDNQDDNE
jgi:hypothetical protein